MFQLNNPIQQSTRLGRLAYRTSIRLQSSLPSADGTISSIHQQESSELSSPSGQSTQGLRPNTFVTQRTPPRDASVQFDQSPEPALDAPVEPTSGISHISTGSRFLQRLKLFQSQLISDSTSATSPRPDLRDVTPEETLTSVTMDIAHSLQLPKDVADLALIALLDSWKAASLCSVQWPDLALCSPESVALTKTHCYQSCFGESNVILDAETDQLTLTC